MSGKNTSSHSQRAEQILLDPSIKFEPKTIKENGDQMQSSSPENLDTQPTGSYDYETGEVAQSLSAEPDSTAEDPIEKMCAGKPTGGNSQQPTRMDPNGLCRVHSHHFEGLVVSTNESTVHVPVNIYDRGMEIHNLF